MIKKITPCLWFDSEAEEAAKFYVSIFPNSKIKHVEKYAVESPSKKKVGSVMTVTFNLDGNEFLGLNGGPFFKLNPTISFVVECSNEKEVDRLWNKLSEKGKVLMPLQQYPFSKKYGWLQDKFGVSWQISVKMNAIGIYPALMFVGKNFGKCEEAINFYTKIFPNSKTEFISRYEKGEHDKEGAVKWSIFHLNGQRFAAIESSHNHKFDFNEAVSFMIEVKDQKEVDYYYKKLSHVKEAEQCGWMKDKYGVSWQLIPKNYDEMMSKMDPGKKKRMMEVLLEMKRINLKELEDA